MSDGADDLRAFWRRAVGLAHLLVLPGAVVLYLTLDNGRAAALGLVLGGAVSVLRFNLKYRALRRLRSRGAAASLVAARLVGFALTGLVLAAAFLKPEAAWPWSTLAGLVVMNISVVAAQLLWPPRADAAEASARGR